MAAANSGIETDASKPYAELWMGEFVPPWGPSVNSQLWSEPIVWGASIVYESEL